MGRVERSYVKIKVELVDGDGIASGVVLHHTSEKRLSEVESRHPEHRRFPFIKPFLVLKRKDKHMNVV